MKIITHISNSKQSYVIETKGQEFKNGVHDNESVHLVEAKEVTSLLPTKLISGNFVKIHAFGRGSQLIKARHRIRLFAKATGQSFTITQLDVDLLEIRHAQTT